MNCFFDPTSLKEIAAFYGISALLQSPVQQALQDAGDLIVQTAQANTWTAFQNPTGALAENIAVVGNSPYEIEIGVDAPQAHRLEAGFYGTDSLGRTYNQAAEPYAQPALDMTQQQILQMIEAAITNTFTDIGGGA